MRSILSEKLNTKRKTILIVSVVIVVLVICTIGGLTAKYIYDNIGKDTQVVARDFYFTVDLLGDTNELSDLETDIHLFGGGDKTVPFTVKSYFDDLRINNKDITYTATIECDNGSYNKATFTTKPSDFVMTANVKADDAYVISMPAGYERAGKTTTVTAVIKSSAPYEKEMRLNFVLHADDAPMTYRVEDNAGDAFATLIVMANEDVAANKITVDWSTVNNGANNLQVDTTSPQVLDNTVKLTTNTPGSSYLTGITTTRALKKGESIQIYFFKADPSVSYSKPDTQVSANASGVYALTIEQN